MCFAGVTGLFALPSGTVNSPVIICVWVLFFYLLYDIGSSFFAPNLIFRTLTLDPNERGKLLIAPRIYGMIISMLCASFLTIINAINASINNMAGNQHNRSCSSLEDYNQLCPGNSLRRIAVIIDEIAELTDSTGMSKEQKELAKSIVAQLSTLARLGRAFGINLFLGTQRPDATAIPGQIKNNLDVRICGKADQTLSMIILDNTSASDLIPKDSQGLFLNQDGVLFRGYLLNQ